MANRSYRVMLARFPGQFSEHPASSDWRVEFVKDCLELKSQGRLAELTEWWQSDTPITMSRNKALKIARDASVDLLVCIDSDMGPDQEGTAKKKFWPAAFEFIDENYDKGPMMLAAPYCGAPPHENIFIFRWRNFQSTHPSFSSDYSLEQFTREEAAERGGWGDVAALPTGLCVIDMRLITGMKSPRTGEIVKLDMPWFDYEWKDAERSEKASTEDVYFSRNASLKFEMHGFGPVCWCLWDSWAIHYKQKAVMPPRIIGSNDVADYLRSADHKQIRTDQKLVTLRRDRSIFANGKLAVG